MRSSVFARFPASRPRRPPLGYRYRMVCSLPFNIVGRQNAGPFTGAAVAVPASADYLETLGIPLLRGRRFDANDGRGAPAVVVINQAMADQYWADGADPFADRDARRRHGHSGSRRRAATPDHRHRRQRPPQGDRRRRGAGDVFPARAALGRFEHQRDPADGVDRAHERRAAFRCSRRAADAARRAGSWRHRHSDAGGHVARDDLAATLEPLAHDDIRRLRAAARRRRHLWARGVLGATPPARDRHSTRRRGATGRRAQHGHIGRDATRRRGHRHRRGSGLPRREPARGRAVRRPASRHRGVRHGAPRARGGWHGSRLVPAIRATRVDPTRALRSY